MMYSSGKGVTLRHRGRVLGAVVAASALALSVTACTSSTEDASADGKTVLKVQGWKGGGTEIANIDQINDAFQEANPDIELQFEYVPPNDAYSQKVQPELLAGNGADVIMTDVTRLPGWSQAGYLMDLSDASWLDKVDPGMLPSITLDGAVYAQPMEAIAEGLFANTDLLAEAGIDEIPTTWSEFEEDLATLDAAGITPISFPNKAGDTAQMSLNGIASTLIYQDNPDWDNQFNAGDASFVEWQPALDQISFLQDEGYVDFKESLGVDEWSQGLNDFASGKYAFWFQGAWEIQAIQKAGLDNFTFNPWPAAADGAEPSVGIISGTSWSVNAATEVPEAAEAYLDFWADPANAAPFLEAEHALTPWAGAENAAEPVSQSILDAYADGRFHLLPRDSWLSAEGNKTMKSALQAWMLGQYATDEELLEDLDESLRPSN
ncbi:ABC transporter substrate-binding protein [Microbacterium marmarense]|uniref:Extracellular solute-binding protein n=1 Tax=Microbacterium marmarense TaxID=3122051 RepID=A0ABU8LSN5_9MICO